MGQLLQGYQKTAPGMYALNSQWLLPYTGLNLQGQQAGLFGITDPTTGQVIQPGTLALQSGANTYGRVANLNDVSALGPLGYGALMQSNPGLAFALGQANNAAYQNSGPNSLLGLMQAHALDDKTSPLLPQMTADAQQALASAGRLSPEQMTAIDQNTLGNYAAQGLATSPSAIAAQVLNRDSAVQQRLGAARNYAQQVQGANLANTAQAWNIPLQVQGALGQQQGQLASLAALNANIYDPFQTITGRGSSSLAGFGSGGPAASNASAGSFNVGTLFNPNLNDAFMTAFNANQANNIASQNRDAALYGGLINAGGNILGGYLAGGGFGLSDRRAKKHIKRIGTAPSGAGIYKFQYRGKRSAPWHIGPMAQQLERVTPGAVRKDPKSGLRYVDRAKTDVPFIEIGKLLNGKS